MKKRGARRKEKKAQEGRSKTARGKTEMGRRSEGHYASIKAGWKDSRSKTEHLPSDPRLFEESVLAY